MKPSTSIRRLKRRARQLARERDIALHVALDAVSRAEGFARWSLLAARVAKEARRKECVPDAPAALLPQLDDGDLVLIGARPEQGKTRLALQALVDAARTGRQAVFFTLEWSEREARAHLEALGAGSVPNPPAVVASGAISAGTILHRLAGAAPGTLAMVDYLQRLDQDGKPALAEQMRALRGFAREQGTVLGFTAQIGPSFDPAAKPLPGMEDVRLPGPVDPNTFSKACFLHGGRMRLEASA